MKSKLIIRLLFLIIGSTSFSQNNNELNTILSKIKEDSTLLEAKVQVLNELIQQKDVTIFKLLQDIKEKEIQLSAKEADLKKNLEEITRLKKSLFLTKSTETTTYDYPNIDNTIKNNDDHYLDNSIYNTAGIEVKPEFPGGIEKFYSFVGQNYQMPNVTGLRGKVYVTFVIEKDGSLTDIKVLRDIGYGTGEEAIRVLSKCPKWNPAIQNGKPVRCLYSLPITVQSRD